MMEIANEEFPPLWQEIGEVLFRFAGHFGHEKQQELQKAIDKVLKYPLTQKDEINVDELKRWYENDIQVKKAVEELKVATQEGMAHLETALGRKWKQQNSNYENIFRQLWKISKISCGNFSRQWSTLPQQLPVVSLSNVIKLATAESQLISFTAKIFQECRVEESILIK